MDAYHSYELRELCLGRGFTECCDTDEIVARDVPRYM